MASESSNQKRKRGRPPNASKPPALTTASQSAAAAPVEYDADAEEENRPKKRGRPRTSTDNATKEDAKPRKRGRPSLDKTTTNPDAPGEAPDSQGNERARRAAGKATTLPEDSREKQTDGQGVDEAPPRKRRGRPSPQEAKEDDQQLQKASEGSEGVSRRKRGRPSLQPEKQTEELPDPEPEEAGAAEQPSRKKRGRPSLQTPVENEEEPPTRKKPRDRQSLQDLSPSGAQNTTAGTKDKNFKASKDKSAKAPKKNGKQSSNNPTEEAPESNDTKTKKKKKSTQPTETTEPPADGERTAADAEAPEPEDDQQPDGRRRRRSKQGADADANAPPSPPKPYTHVAPRVHRVRQSVIEDKWSPLSGASLAAATTILQLAHRPILQRLSSTQQRRAHATAALRLVASRIARKMHKGLPFPPASMAAPRGRKAFRNAAAASDGGREAELDFERVLDARRALERQLDPALHAVDLLRQEKSRVERELERDYQALKTLETGARAQAREHRGLLKKAHVLAPEKTASQRGEDVVEVEFKREATEFTEGLFKGLDEEVLQPLALQLSGHVDSIKTNLQQAKDIVPQIALSKAVLQDMLLQHLDQEQYEQVVLG